MTPTISIGLIDDNRFLRDGMAEMLWSLGDVAVFAMDVEEALPRIRELRPRVVLLDLGLADHDSLGLAAEIHTQVPATRVIVMGFVPDQEDVASFVQVGASGFIMKDASFDELVHTIRTVASGAEVLPQALTNSVFSHIAMRAMAHGRNRALESVRLTERERQVIDLLKEGLSNKDIATRLSIAVHTVKSHVHNVLEKLSLRSRLEVAAYTHASENTRIQSQD